MMNTDRNKKIALILLGAVVVALFLWFDLGRYLTLAYLKGSQARLQTLYAAEPLLVVAVYMAFYILVTALSLPGAVVLGLAGGGLFGFWLGTLVVSCASTIGATIACYVARVLLREWVQSRFGAALAQVNQGVEQEGAFYLFTLRLIPIVPFFVINLVMGLTRMPLTTFFWVSQLGMLLGTMVFVNAGKELAKIDSLAGIVSPGLLLSFVLLGLFPITMKKATAWYRKRQA
jgi:uncharacterized membrane protein YdjX (TVP38/TMEM64 family)